jgi:hypothetical protein
VNSSEATRGSEPSIRGGQVAEIQRSRELGGSLGRSPKLEVPSCKWRSHERIRALHLRRTGGRDLEIS